MMNYLDIKKFINEGKYILIANGNIYDLTNVNHPFDFKKIRKNGSDVTQDFKFHTNNQKKQWEKYKIGYLYNKSNNCIIL